MAGICKKNEDPDQTPRSAASDLDLHCLPNTLLGVSRLQWVLKVTEIIDKISFLFRGTLSFAYLYVID